MTRKLIKFIFNLVLRLLFRTKVIGAENIPSQGGAILAINHIGMIDAPLVVTTVGRDDATALVAKKHLKNPLLRWLINGLNGIWLNRDEADTQAIRAARDFLQRGGVLGIAPEGTRSPDGGMLRPKTGIAFIADKARVPIIPVAITGTRRGVYRMLQLKRPKISVRYGEPFMLPPVERANRDEQLQKNTDEIMIRIAAMLPPEYHGYYKDHPRLIELLNDSKAGEPGLPNPAATVIDRP